MGNLCGSSSKSTAFSSPGRTLSSAPPPPDTRTPIPARASKPQTVGGPPRTIGGSSAQDDPREAAAKAAEARAKPQTKGQLSQRLAEQKRQTGGAALAQASREERGARDQDVNAEARAYN